MVFDALLHLDDRDILSDCRALCTVSVRAGWDRLLPRIRCHEPWVTRDVDWHVYPNGELCIEIDQRWADVMRYSQVHMSADEVAQYAADFFFNSTNWLLARHRYAFENSLSVWPSAWPQWAHGAKGVQEYRSQKTFF